MTSPLVAVPARPQLSLGRKILASVVTGFTVAVIAHLTAVFLLLVANQLSAGIFGQVNALVIYGSPFFLIALIVFGFIGIFQRWYFAAAAGFVLSLGAVIGGTPLYVAAQGAVALSVNDLLATLLTFNAPFLIAGTLAAVFVGVPLYRRLTAASAAPAVARRVALVRVPADNLAEGEVTHISRTAIDTDLANEQWDNYVTALLESGWTTIEVEPAAALADSVFVEDAVVMFGETAVITSPGAESRRGEIVAVEASVAELGLAVERIELPGTLDGGDVLKVGSTVYVGRGGRTNAEGIRQLRAILATTDYSVVAVPLTKVLHLKSAVTALPDGTVIGYPPLVDDIALFDRFLSMPEEGGAHVVVLAADTVLMAASAPQSQALIADLGYRVVSVDISEFEKLEGCVTCLSVRVR